MKKHYKSIARYADSKTKRRISKAIDKTVKKDNESSGLLAVRG